MKKVDVVTASISRMKEENKAQRCVAVELMNFLYDFCLSNQNRSSLRAKIICLVHRFIAGI